MSVAVTLLQQCSVEDEEIVGGVAAIELGAGCKNIAAAVHGTTRLLGVVTKRSSKALTINSAARCVFATAAYFQHTGFFCVSAVLTTVLVITRSAFTYCMSAFSFPIISHDSPFLVKSYYRCMLRPTLLGGQVTE
jgi:hypothetical protein